MAWPEPKLSVGDQVVAEKIALELLLYCSLHDLADVAEQRNGTILRWVSFGVLLVDWYYRSCLPVDWKHTCEKQSSNSRQRGLASSALHSLRTLVGILYGPVALCCRSFLTCFGLEVILSKELVVDGLTTGAWSSAS